MTTKTASIRLEQELYDRIDEHCVSKACSRNDFIKSAIESALDKDDDVAHKAHHDSHGNYWTWSHDRKIWTCHVNMDNVKVIE